MPTYTAPTTRTTGELISAAIFNTDLVENLKYFKDAPAFAGAVTVGGTLGVTGLITSTGGITGGASSHTTGAFSSTVTGGTYNGQTISSAASFTGTLAFSASSSPVTGGIGVNATYGLYQQGKTGTTYDWAVLSAAGNYAYRMPVGTVNMEMLGLLTVSGFGTHTFTGSGTGGNRFNVYNSTAGTGNFSAFDLGTDQGTNGIVSLYALSSTYTTANMFVQNSGVLYSSISGGLSIGAAHASGSIRFYAHGSTERGRFSGFAGFPFYINTTAQLTATDHKMGISVASGDYGLVLRNNAAATTVSLIITQNSVGGIVGSITGNDTATSFNTSSDARLKTDGGLATDVSLLRATKIHNFTWTANGEASRGVFAQEAYAVAPFAVSKGDDGDDITSVWGVDYSKYVPDLIVGWQQHDATITQLAARIAALESQDN